MTNLSALMAATSSALGWLLWSLLVGSLANRLPAAWLERQHWFWRRPWREQPQGFEKRLVIRRWKPWLPDAGHLGQQPLGPALNRPQVSLWWRRHGLFPSGIKARKPGAQAPGFC